MRNKEQPLFLLWQELFTELQLAEGREVPKKAILHTIHDVIGEASGKIGSDTIQMIEYFALRLLSKVRFSRTDSAEREFIETPERSQADIQRQTDYVNLRFGWQASTKDGSRI